MKKVFAAVFLLLSLRPAFAGDVLYLYTWDTYVAPELFRAFEKETGIRVVTDIYASNDTLMARLESGAAYDVAAPSGNYVPLLVAQGLLAPLPESLRALGEGLSPPMQKPAYDPEYTHALPLFYGTTALAVNRKLTGEHVTSWRRFFARPAGAKADLGVLDDIGTVMDVASLAIGKPFCDPAPDTLKALRDLLLGQKPFVKVYGATGYFERLAANEVAIQMAWSGDVWRVRRQNKDIDYVYPEEGVELWADNLVIPKAARNRAAAEKFIAFALRPENSAAYAEISGNVPAIAAAMPLLPPALKESPAFRIPEGVKTEVSTACAPEVVRAYNDIWEKLMR